MKFYAPVGETKIGSESPHLDQEFSLNQKQNRIFLKLNSQEFIPIDAHP